MPILDVLFLVCLTLGATWAGLSVHVTRREWGNIGRGVWGSAGALRRAALLRAALLPLFYSAGVYVICALLILPFLLCKNCG